MYFRHAIGRLGDRRRERRVEVAQLAANHGTGLVGARRRRDEAREWRRRRRWRQRCELVGQQCDEVALQVAAGDLPPPPPAPPAQKAPPPLAPQGPPTDPPPAPALPALPPPPPHHRAYALPLPPRLR